MLAKPYLGFVFLVSAPALTQIATSSQMQVPPPVSDEAYSTAVNAEARSNYIHAGITVNTAYNDNVLVGTSMKPDNDLSYSIWPTISLDQTTPRLHQTFTYSPGFTFYQHTGSRNEADQNLTADFQYRLSPHITLSLQDSFRKSSNVFNQSYPGATVSGSTQTPLTPVVAPIADQVNNVASTEVTYQFARNSMVGASGVFSNLYYPHPSEAPGLSNSSSRGAGAFYSYRVSRAQYLGATYQYSQTSGNLPGVQNEPQENSNSQINNQAILAFYTVYLKPNLSLSLSAGPQHYEVIQSPYPKISAFAPLVAASFGWQEGRAGFALSYAHVVGGGGGLLGAFNSNSANASAGWQATKSWTTGATADYTITKNVSPFLAQLNPGGHIFSESINAQHLMGNRVSLAFGYQHIHQSYSNIEAVSIAPDANREYVSISYQLTRPLGR